MTHQERLMHENLLSEEAQASLERWLAERGCKFLGYALEGHVLRVRIVPAPYPEHIQIELGFETPEAKP
jgi:hypothetical protein